MIKKLVLICAVSLFATNVLTQVSRDADAVVLAIIQVGDGGYSILEETGTNTRYKTSFHVYNELSLGQQVTLVFYEDNKIEVLAVTLSERLFCRPLISKADAAVLGVVKPSENEVDAVNRDMEISPFPYCLGDGNPVGGSTGYDDIITTLDADMIITSSSASAFKSAVEGATSGTVTNPYIIYIQDGLTISLSGLGSPVYVPSHVIIAGGRGNTGSPAKIRTTDYSYESPYNSAMAAPLLIVEDVENIRITGLIFEGPSGIVGGNTPATRKIKSGIQIWDANDVSVDNCELKNFPLDAVEIGGGCGSEDSIRIHHCYLHNNVQKGYGYGVMMLDGFAKIYANVFQTNGHDITGTGVPECGYEAFCNTIRTGGTGPNFDMHNEGESHTDPDVHTTNAGRFIYIHHNDFKDVGASRGSSGIAWNVYIRGRPDYQCRIENNRFAHMNHSAAINQTNNLGDLSRGNMLVWNNIFSQTEYRGVYVHENWDHNEASNYVLLDTDGHLFLVATGVWALNFGDVDDDGYTDIFRVENNEIHYMTMDASNGYNQGWGYLTYTTYSPSVMLFGNYNSDGKTDLVVKPDNYIYISDGISSSWTTLNYTGYTLASIRMGQFNSNDNLDLFATSGSDWLVSWESTATWASIKTHPSILPNVMLGDINADGKTDVVYTSGSTWYWSDGGTGALTYLNSSGYTGSIGLFMGDFNGDGISDVIRSDARYLSVNGAGSWVACNTSNFPISTFTFGNF